MKKSFPKGNTRAAQRAPSRFVFLFLFIAAGLLLRDCGLYAQTELGSEDDLTVLGTNGSADDPDVEIKGFTVFGSTQAAYTGAAAGPGSVVVNGALSVSSGAYFVGNSTFTNASKIFINDGSPGQVLRKNAAGYLDWDSASSLGDNLGSHDAAQRLNMGNFAVWSSSAITAARYQINGSTVLAVLTGGSLGVGVGAGRINTSGNNAFVGPYAGYSNASGGNNSFLGNYAGYSNTSGGNNSFLGNYAGYGNTTGGSNSFVGNYAGRYNTTAWGNSFVGDYAGYKNTTGETNSIVGNSAGYYNEAGSANAILGSQAGYSGPFSSSTLVGYKAGYQLNAGSGGNTLIGYQAGFNVVSGTGNIIIGYDKRAPTAGTNNHLNIGDVLYGDLSAKTIGISTRAPQAALDIVSTGTTVNEYAQIWRGSDGVVRASMTATGKLFADISGSLGGGDNLGNHTATQDLNMQASQLTGTGALTMSSITASGPFGVWAARMALESDIEISSYTSAVYGEGVYASPAVFTPGLAITSYGEVHTAGVGRGSVAGAARGSGAVDLQVNRGITTQVASGGYAVIGGGQQNTAAGLYSVVPGGSQNTAGNQYSTVGGGVGNNASGDRAVVPGGDTNLAGGLASFAAGSYAKANAAGAFTWADSQGVAVDNAVADRAVFKTRGGFMITGSTDPVLSGNMNRGMLVTGDGLVGISTGAPQAALDVVSTGTAPDNYVQIWRNSDGIVKASMTATGKLFADISGSLGGGDNLGDHTATAHLDMADKAIFNASSMTVSGVGITGSNPVFTVAGSTFNILANGNVGIGASPIGTNKLRVSDGNVLFDIPGTSLASALISWPGNSPNFRLSNSVGTEVVNINAQNGANTYLNSGGNVGIGTTGPGAKLHAVETSGSSSYIFVASTATDPGSYKMVVSTTGNVGIGTASPQAKLSLEGDGSAIQWGVGASPTGRVLVNASGGGNSNMYIGPAQAGAIVNSITMVGATGNVGIGTTSPGAKLNVVGGRTTLRGATADSSEYTLLLENSTPANIAWIRNDGLAHFAGNVGIGTTNPGYKLDVAGTMNAQEVRVNGVVLNPGTGSNWTVSGADVYRNGGNVGIGTTAPGAKLDLRGTGDILRIAYDDGGIGKRIDVNATSGSNTLQYVSNDLNFWDSTLPRVTFKQGGNVGIGTTTPAGLLNIKGVSGTGQLIIDNAASNSNSQMMFRSNGLDLVSAGTNQSVGDDNNFEIYSRKSGQTKSLMFMNLTTGNVGIGTASPGAMLDVAQGAGGRYRSTINPNFYVTDTAGISSFYFGTPSGSDDEMALATNGLPRLYVTSAGNVGIGTTTPTGLFQVGGGSLTVLNSGNVGIGTTSPGAKLSIRDDFNGLQPTLELVNGAAPAAGIGSRIRFADGSNNSTGWIDVAWEGAATTNSYMRFINRGASSQEVMRITSAGNVGIGTTGPAAKLHAVETSGSNSYIFVASTATDPGAYKMVVSTAGRIGVGTPAPEQKMHIFSDATMGEAAPYLQVETTHPSNYAIRYLTKYGSTGLDTILPAGTSSGYGIMVSGGDQSVGGGGIIFKTDGNNTRMFIRKDGNVGIGTTGPGYKLDVNGDMNLAAGSVYRIAGVAQSGSSKWTAGTGDDIYRNLGNVGIGTTAPGARLDIGTSKTGSEMVILSNTGTGTTDSAEINVRNEADPNAAMRIQVTGTGYTTIGGLVQDSGSLWSATGLSGGLSIGARASAPIRFYTAGYADANERMRIDPTGNVGIGTTSPDRRLQVAFNTTSTSGDAPIISARNTNTAGASLAQLTAESDNAAIVGQLVTVGATTIGTQRANTVAVRAYSATVNPDLAFFTSPGGALTERLTITSAGNVGIGTTNPGALLHISGSNGGYITKYSSGTAAGQLIGETTWGSSPASFIVRGSAGKALQLGANESNNMTILTNGNVGIGTTNPVARLEVVGGANAYTAIFQSDTTAGQAWGPTIRAGTNSGDTAFVINDASNATPYFRVRGDGNVGIGTTGPGAQLEISKPAGNTYATRAAWNNGDASLRLSDTYVAGTTPVTKLVMNTTSGGYNNGAIIHVEGAGAYNAGQLVFSTGWDSSGNATERMRIRNDGNVGIGTTNPGYALTVNGTAWVTSGAWSGSDKRWKKDVTPLQGSLDKIMKLQGVGYNWKTKEFPELKFSTAPQIGLIAQEVENIVPEVVTTGKDGYKGISYEKLVPILIEAVKEQQKEIRSLKIEVMKLKKEDPE